MTNDEFEKLAPFQAAREAMVGRVFSRLTITGYVVNKDRLRFICKCSCGNEVKVLKAHLVNSKTKSCGCFQKECASANHKRHGLTYTKVHNSWRSMIRRCCDPKNQNYKWYGGRGIKVCNEWLEFEQFYKDMGEPPSNSHSIDRIDNEIGYTKSNCRWADKVEQGRNKSSTKLSIEFAQYIRDNYKIKSGKSNTKELARKFGVSTSAIKRVLSGDTWAK